MKPIRRLGILQPVYLPWLGYFEQIGKVDHFVFQDDVQYTTHDWRNRNQIKAQNGGLWLIVPVKRAPLDTRLDQIEICYERSWIHKQIRSMKINYAKAPFVTPVVDVIEEMLESRPKLLVDLTMKLVAIHAKELRLNTSLSRSSDIPRAPNAGLNQRILEIAVAHEATHLYLGAKARDYVLPEFFAPHGITLEFQDFVHPVYPQQHGEFLSHMSVIDYLMNVPPDEREAFFP
jgi:hypothetical protein